MGVAGGELAAGELVFAVIEDPFLVEGLSQCECRLEGALPLGFAFSSGPTVDYRHRMDKCQALIATNRANTIDELLIEALLASPAGDLMCRWLEQDHEVARWHLIWHW